MVAVKCISLEYPDLTLLLSFIFLSWLFFYLLYSDLHQSLFLGFALLLLHDYSDASIGRGMFLLFLLGQMLLYHEHLQMRLFFLFELALFLALADVGLEVFELLLGGSLTLLVIIHWLGDGLDGSISDGDEDGLIVLVFFLAAEFLSLLCELFLEFADAYLVLDHFFSIGGAFLLPLLVVEAVFGVEEGSADVGLIGGDLGLYALHV